MEPEHRREGDCRRSSGWRVWLEVEVALLVALSLAIYFSRLTDLTIRGEESRWAQVAYEMLQTGDWIVPRQQGKPFPDRPPLNSWAMAACSSLLGEWNLAAVRLPSALATLLTSLVIYGYARNFLSRVGALAAAAAYPSMLLVLQLGRLAESDALLVLLVSGSLFAWHAGYMRRWPSLLTWSLGYSLAAAAALDKGPQGPVYFVGPVFVYLLATRDWRYLLAPAHLGGVLAFAAVLGAWQIPFWMHSRPEDVAAIWSEGSTLSNRFNYSNVGAALAHLAGYPLQVLACMLPWSAMLLVAASRGCRQTIGEARPWITFLLTCCLVAFPTCWLPVDSRPRYFLSLYPCVAVLAGLMVERCWHSPRRAWWERSWSRLLSVHAILALCGALVVIVAAICPAGPLELVAQTPTFTCLFALACVGLAYACWHVRNGRTLMAARVGILAVACIFGLAYTGLVVNMLDRTSNQAAGSIAELKKQLPPGVKLVSFRTVHHLFAYYYRDPIALQKWPRDAAQVDPNITYFCFDMSKNWPQDTLPFAWEPVAEICCDRHQRADPIDKVIIGRRIPQQAGQPAVGSRQ
jgi:4-amino-4-deoxy-L-arabinose transferase-like glycosyltransferase